MTGHDKGRDCARTDEVLANYRRRAIAAETELIRTRGPGRPSTGVRVDIRIPTELLDRIDTEATYGRAVPLNRAETIRRLLDLSLEVVEAIRNPGYPD